MALIVNVSKIAEKIQERLSKKAISGCSSIYELYAVRYSDSIDEWFYQNSGISNLFKPYLTDKQSDYITEEERGTEDEAVGGVMNCFFCGKPLTLCEMSHGDACSDCI